MTEAERKMMAKITELHAELEAVRARTQADTDARSGFESRIEAILDRLLSDLQDLSALVYKGNGRESLTTRVYDLEGRIKDLKETFDKRSVKTDNRNWQLLVAIVGWLIAMGIAVGGWLIK